MDKIGEQPLPSLIKEVVQPGNVTLTNIYDLPPEEANLLREKINATRGTCQVWVHDHYHTHDPYLTDNGKDFEAINYQRYLPERDKLVKRSLTTAMPIIAFIETLGIPEKDEQIFKNYQKSYQQLATTQEPVTIYYVPTHYWNPTPCTLPENFEHNKTTENDSGGAVNPEGEWNKLITIFRSLGINKAVVSGAYYDELEYNVSELDDPTSIYDKEMLLAKPSKIKGDKIIKGHQCVATTIEALEAGGIKTFKSTVLLSSDPNKFYK